jgi:hypothetical protein
MNVRRLLVLTIAVSLALGGMAGVRALAGGPSPFVKPPKGTLTVPSAPPGKDYKSNPAPPEPIQVFKNPPTIGELQKTMDPNDSPNIRICVNKDGSGAIQFITPAQPDAQVNPAAAAIPQEKDDLINDKGAC